MSNQDPVKAAKPEKTTDKPTEKPKRTRTPRPKTDFALADEAVIAMLAIDVKIAKARGKLDAANKERDDLTSKLSPSVRKLLGIEIVKAAE